MPIARAQTQTGTNYPGAEVEPFVDVNLLNDDSLVGVWQQDRWSNGGATGNLNAYSEDGGDSWTIPPRSPAPNTGQAKFTRCTFGNALNGGDYERATDPWVSFSPNGVAQQISLGINDSNVDNAVIASRSEDGGKNWDDPAGGPTRRSASSRSPVSAVAPRGARPGSAPRGCTGTGSCGGPPARRRP